MSLVPRDATHAELQWFAARQDRLALWLLFPDRASLLRGTAKIGEDVGGQ